MGLLDRQVFAVRICLAIWCLNFFLHMALGTGSLPLLAETQFGVGAGTFLSVAWLGVACSACFGAGLAVRLSAGVALLSLQLFLWWLPMIHEVTYPYLSMMLLVFALFYETNGRFGIRSRLRRRELWFLPLFLAVYVGLSISGASKLLYGPWRDGNVFSTICPYSPLAGWVGAGVCGHLPSMILSTSVVVTELLSFPLAVVPRTRLLIWCAVTVLQGGIFLLVSVWPVTAGMLVLQIFLFDPSWLAQRLRPIVPRTSGRDIL